MKNHIADITVTALMAAVICVVAPFSIPIGSVPITFATFAVYISLYVLGWKKATIACLIYIAIGIIGLPVFSGFGAGIGKVVGPTGGYLVGYLLITLVGGYLVEKFRGKIVLSFAGLLIGTILCYLAGTIWLLLQMNLSFAAAVGIAVLPFIPGDCAKIIVAGVLGPVIQKSIHAIESK